MLGYENDALFLPEVAQLSRSCQFCGGAENCLGKWQNIQNIDACAFSLVVVVVFFLMFF